MKIIISERQQKLISESVMGKFIERMIPELDKLNRKSDYSRKKYGHNEIYYNKETKDFIFRYEYAGLKHVFDFKDDGTLGFIKRDDPNILWIKKDIYDEIKSYIPSDEMILQWFNKRYNKDAKVLKTHYTLKDK